MSGTFYNLCTLIQQIRETRETNKKIVLFADYLSALRNDIDLNLASQFIGEGAFDSISGKRASVGSRTSGLAAAEFCKIDYELVFKPCRTATGSSSETVERLMANLPAAVDRRNPQYLPLTEIQEIFEQLYQACGRADKQVILWHAWEKMTPLEIKYFNRILGHGSLRIGFETRSVETAIANAFGQNSEDVQYAHMITGSIGKTAVLARHNRLIEARFNLFQPLSFMLASPIESCTVESLEQYIAEEKFDGMRAQVHADGNNIKIFSRDLNNITPSLPDVVEFLCSRSLPPLVFDGEICVFRDQTIMPFQVLQKRLGIKKPGKKILEQLPVLFIAYDLLYANRTLLFDLPLTTRRGMLEDAAVTYNLPITTQYHLNNINDVDTYFDRALKHGNEGLILKLKHSLYEYGQRKKSWIKVKKPGGSFDTVMMYAHTGSGNRGGNYSDFTLGISVKEDDRYEEEFIPIGKVFGGYTDEEIKLMNQKIKELTVERYGPTLGLIPKLVVEIEFDDIRVNPRTKAGYTFHLPRFKAIRFDLGPDDVNTLKDVEQYYRKKLEAVNNTQQQNPSIIFEEFS